MRLECGWNAAKCSYNVFFKETLSKLHIIISRLYEQLRERPKAHFSQIFKLYTLQHTRGPHSVKTAHFLQFPPGARNLRELRRTTSIHSILHSKLGEGRNTLFHFLYPPLAAAQIQIDTPTQTPLGINHAKSQLDPSQFREVMIRPSLHCFS